MSNIENNIPIPKKLGRRLSEAGFTADIRALEINQSLFVKGAIQGNIHSRALNATKHQPHKKFTSRSMDGGVRIWRIE